MVSTFTPNKHIEQPGFNDYVDSWDVPVNADWSIIDTAFGGVVTKNATALSGNVNLATAEYQPLKIIISGTPAGAINYRVPSGVGGMWVVLNDTTNGQVVTFDSGAGGSAIQLPVGINVLLTCDGTATGMQQASPSVKTGDIKFTVDDTAEPGWIFAWGTIGSAASAATNRANADTQALFTVLWNRWADAQAPVSGGRGVSAAADFAANKTIAVPDLRGRFLGGLDTQPGSTAAGRITGATMSPNGNTIGATGGQQTEQVGITGTAFVNGGTSGPNNVAGTNTGGGDFATAIHGHSVIIDAPVSGVTATAVNVPPAMLLPIAIKL